MNSIDYLLCVHNFLPLSLKDNRIVSAADAILDIESDAILDMLALINSNNDQNFVIVRLAKTYRLKKSIILNSRVRN